MIRRLKDKLKTRVAGIARKEIDKAMEDLYARLPDLIAFHNSRPEERQSFYDHTKDPMGHAAHFAGIKDDLVQAGAPVREVDVDIPDFDRWLAEFPELRVFYARLKTPTIEKCLEHYLAYRHLQITPADVYIDVAASGSPWVKVLRARGVQGYRLDLAYPAGIHGMDIGADACATGLKDGFATVLSAQCAYNTFMGDADVRFLREAARLLGPGGRCGVFPLCVDDTYMVARSPYVPVPGFVPDPGAKSVWRDDEHHQPFSRQYAPAVFKSRVIANLPAGLSGEVLFLRNLVDVMKHFPGERVYGYFAFLLRKSRR